MPVPARGTRFACGGRPRRLRRPVDGRRAQGRGAFVCTGHARDVGVARAGRAVDVGPGGLYATWFVRIDDWRTPIVSLILGRLDTAVMPAAYRKNDAVAAARFKASGLTGRFGLPYVFS